MTALAEFVKRPDTEYVQDVADSIRAAEAEGATWSEIEREIIEFEGGWRRG